MNIQNIDGAIAAHRQWVARFHVAMLEEGEGGELFNLNEARDDRACALGGWLHSPQALAAMGGDFHGRVLSLHGAFHEIAYQIASRFNERGERADLGEIREFIGEFDNLSAQLIELLEIARSRM